MKKALLLLVFFAFLINSEQVFAQCAQNWDDAQSEFKEGHLYSIPSLLQDCIEGGTKQEKIDAYRMLTITYLYIDDPYGAQNSFLGLLKLDPEYRIKPSDPVELEYLSKEFITTPILSWRVRGGINYSLISVINKNGSGNTNLDTERYKGLIGGSIIGSLDVHFNKIISLGIEADASINKFNYNNKLFDDEIGNQNAKDLQTFTEWGYNISLPVYLRLTYPGVTYYPYVYGGYSPNYNVYTTSTASYNVINKINGNENPIEERVLDISPLRNRVSHSIVVGAGLKRRIKYQYVFVDLRYKIGLKNLLNSDNQYVFLDDPDKYKDVNEYSGNYKQIDSQFRESDFSLTVGYVWPQYKPRRRREVTFGSMLKGMFNKKNKDE